MMQGDTGNVFKRIDDLLYYKRSTVCDETLLSPGAT